MHASFREAAARAAEGDVAGTLRHVGAAMGQCNACHVTYRLAAEQ
jgi:cytochrome c556